MQRALVALAVLVVSCNPGVEAAETTDTVVAPTTEPSAPPTTTTTAVVTTTTQPTTTTAPATTSPTELEGAWAVEPLIVTGFGALGWWDGSDWVRADEAGALPVDGGEEYQVAAIGLRAITTGGPSELVCGPLDNVGVQLANPELLGEWPGPYGVAISAPWDIHPHLFESFEDDGSYASFASEILSERGLAVPDPVIKQLFRVDLEGDGTNEVLVVAEDISGGFLPEVGDYSVAFLRRVVDGDVQTSILGESVVTDPEGSFVVGFSVGSVADLNGDDKMEIVLSSAYFEGLGVTVWEYVDDDIGPFPYLETGCGS